MCHLCLVEPKKRLSRRRFLQLGGSAGVAALLSACGVLAPAGTPTSSVPQFTPLPPTPTRFQTPVPTPLPTSSIPTHTPEIPFVENQPVAVTAVPTPLSLNEVLATHPTIVGQITTLEATLLTVQAPIGAQNVAVAPDVKLYGANGAEMGQATIPAGTTVAVWIVGGQASTIQILPPMAATNDIPDTPEQPPPTGQMLPLGPTSMISRIGWGAADRAWAPGGEAGFYDPQTNPGGWLTYAEPLANWLTSIVVHHSALEFYHGPREIQRLHMHRVGFADVGYHFLIDGLGQVYEGRPFSVRGTHTGGFNTGTVGICLLGNFEVVHPPTAQIQTLMTLINYLAPAFLITHMAGHRDFQPGATVCPGANLWPLLREIASQTGVSFGTDGYAGAPG